MAPTWTRGTDTKYVDLALLSPTVFAKRLSLLLNTYWLLSVTPSAFLGNLPQDNYSAFGLDTLPVNDVDVYLSSNLSSKNTSYSNGWFSKWEYDTTYAEIYFIGATTNSTISRTYPVFVCKFAWLSLLLAAALAVLVVGAASLVLKWRTLGPEMFGFVASMTYENQFARVPGGGSALDGMERARLLRDQHFRVGDVKGDEDVGHIAFATGVPLRKLERGRLYY
ncbi:hypothetical protein SLS61_000449 [Didymella pomorum]